MNPLDLIVLLAIFLAVAFLAAIFNPPGFIAWLREEIRLARAETWANGIYRGKVGTLADPAVAFMAVRQRAMAKRMRRQGRALLGPEKARAAWTPGPRVLEEAQRAAPDNVVQLRAAGGKR